MIGLKKSVDLKTFFFVMGIQRSGGSTLLNAFKRRRNVSIIREKDKSVFDYFMLRPEKDIRHILENSKSITFIEAKSETKKREVSDIFSEYSVYKTKIIWNYRNPAGVYYSRLIKYPHKDWVADENGFCEMWNQRNQSILNALDRHKDNIAIVKLEDLSESKDVFQQLCNFVGTKGKNTFYPDTTNINEELPESVIKNINSQTSDVLRQLDANRRFLP